MGFIGETACGGRGSPSSNSIRGSRGNPETQKDVKNKDRSGDVYENKDSYDKITANKRDNMSEITEICWF